MGTANGISFATFAVGTSIAYYQLNAPGGEFNYITTCLLSQKSKLINESIVRKSVGIVLQQPVFEQTQGYPSLLFATVSPILFSNYFHLFLCYTICK